MKIPADDAAPRAELSLVRDVSIGRSPAAPALQEGAIVVSLEKLSPAGIALLNALGAIVVQSDDWAHYPPVLQVPHVAEILSTTELAVRTAARRGRLPMRKRLGTWMIEKAKLRAWVDGTPREEAISALTRVPE